MNHRRPSARAHTEAMLRWWERWVDRADLAFLRSCGTMIWTHGRDLDQLQLPWARRENARGAEIYIRPARGAAWPLIFLDDVAIDTALAATRRYAALAVQTSPAGGCHLWLATDEPLDEAHRKACQRHLAAKINADPASTSGEHLGRLAGFRNHKRAGVWVNVVAATTQAPWSPPPSVLPATRVSPGRQRLQPPRGPADRSPSGQDWAWVCQELERGADPRRLVYELIERCRERRGRDAERYARRTVDRAQSRA